MADRYWVGGTGSWSSTNTANWSAATGKSITASCATTVLTVTAGTVVVGDTVWSNNHTSLGTITADLGGGNWTVSIGGTFVSQAMSAATVGASVPTAVDSVFFDANSNSGTTAFTVTMANTPRLCNDFTASGLDGTMTLAGSAIGLTVSGSLTFQATNFTRTYTGTTTFNATTTGKTITTNGVAFGAAVTLNGVGGEWVLQDALSTGAGTTTTTTLTNGTLDLNNQTLTTGRFSSSNSNTRTIAFGTGNIACIGTGTVWTTSTSTNLTTTGTQVVNVTSVGATAITVNPPALAESDAISYNFTGGTYTLSLGFSSSTSVKNLNFTGFSGSITGLSGLLIYGDLTLSTGITVSTNFTWTFAATSGTKLITSNGRTLDLPITFNGIGGSWKLQDAMTLGSTRRVGWNAGTTDLNGFTLTAGFGIAFNTTNSRNITFNGGTLLLSSTGATVWNGLGSNFTTTAGTGTGTISMTSASAKTFVGGGFTYNCTLNQGGAGTLTITGANTFNDIANTEPTANQITFPASTTTTVNNFTLSGSAGNLVSIRSSTGGTRFTLSKSSGTVNVSYVDIQDSNATGGATWRALATNGNVDSGNNLGWLFVAGNYVDASADVTSDATVTGSALRVRLFAGDVSAAAAISAIAYRVKLFAGDVSANASVEGQAVRVRVASGDITGNAIVTGIGNITAGGAANVSGFAEVSAYGSATYSFNALVTANADLIAKGEIIGEEWGDSAITSSTWTDATPASSTWQPASQSSNTWLRQ